MEEIKISSALTYGIDTNIASSLLEKFCDDKDTKYKCETRYISNVLLATLGKDALTPQAGHYVSVDLQLVSRVFLTREIVQKRNLIDSRDVDAGYRPESPSPNPGSGNGPALGGEAAFTRERGVNVGFDQMIFRRPVVFGYRAVGFNLLKARGER